MNEFSTALVKVTDIYAPMIERQLNGNGVHLDPYARQCVVNAISVINSVLDSKAISWNDEKLDKNNITQVLMNVAALKLNAAASPREVFFQIRNVNVKAKPSDPDNWRKQIEMGIEGDGNDAILNRFGRNVKQVRPYWLVREKDHFEYPGFNGLEMTPPVWRPTGQGEVVRIVYPIIFNDNSIQYFIGERDDVVKNLIAHMNNNMMNETFGVCADRFKATSEQKKQIAAKKAEILKKAKEAGLGALDDPELQQYISPAWSEFHSREQMLIRKMRNNIVKKIPKDFGSAFVEILHNNVADETYSSVQREISENANSEPIDVEAKVTNETTEAVPNSITETPVGGEATREEGKQEDPAQGDLFDQEMAAAEAYAAGVGATPDF
ncbi:hypothetical protein COLU111180_04320 [Cohnella lubricantis]|uniref:Uncharacterized protein n=1 Tax=Cohnella lubricantis TaxID=2163172 RepID=A0A841T8R1_9BACL|nr:hypothetical protein [Cohnella lubricantis]MBB6676469.1 hypothetical protein [Cohnella lubricantis]MBP2117085.1 putative metal-dependent hydrolase [Cohnella lubricantis]